MSCADDTAIPDIHLRALRLWCSRRRAARPLLTTEGSMTKHRSSANSDEQPGDVLREPSRNDPLDAVEAWWTSLDTDARLTLLRSVSIHETIFGQAVWEELPEFVRLALS